MRVKKELLKLGKHHTRGGVLNATADYIDERISQFRRLQEKGVKVPVTWGHHSGAIPLDPQAAQDEKRFHDAKYKAGDLLDFTREGDTVYIEAEIPAVKRIENGNLIHDVEVEGAKREAAISEVSAGFWDWTDGQGETHKDALIHVALCPLPVAMGQQGFQAAVPAPQPMLLSTSTWFGAIEPIRSTDSHKPVTLATEPQAMPDDEKTPETPEPETNDTPPKEEEKKPLSKSIAEMLQEIGTKLKIGLPEALPDTAEAALELIYTAACVLAGPAPEEPMVDEPSPSSAGAVMLSTAIKSPGWAGLTAKNLDNTTRDGLKSRIEALKKRGLTEQDYKALLAQVPKLELSVSPDDGKVIETHLHQSLAVLERNLPTPKELATDSELVEEKPPSKDHKERSAEVLKELEAKGIIPPAK